MAAPKTYPIRKTLIIGLLLTAAAGANIAVQGSAAHLTAWVPLAGGIGLVILSLVAKMLGRTNA